MNLGKLVVTRAVNEEMKKNKDFYGFIFTSLGKYKNKNFGDLCKEDNDLNMEALKLETQGRILAKYKHEKGNIYIITEWDRSYTTILFCNEY